jgi:hypothetical protein
MAARDLTLTRGEPRAATGHSALNDINTVGQFGKEMLYFVTIMSNILYCQRYTQQNMNYTGLITSMEDSPCEEADQRLYSQDIFCNLWNVRFH